MIYTEDYDFEKYVVLGLKPEILMHIAQNLDMRLFERDDEGYSYYGFFVDKLMEAVVVTTKNKNYDTIRMVFDGQSVLRIEGAGKEMGYPIGSKIITLNKFLREYFDVPHAIDADEFLLDDVPNIDELAIDENFDILSIFDSDESDINDEPTVEDESDWHFVDTRCQWIHVHKDTL